MLHHIQLLHLDLNLSNAFLLKYFSSISFIFGVLVDPPINIISSILFFSKFANLSASSILIKHFY